MKTTDAWELLIAEARKALADGGLVLDFDSAALLVERVMSHPVAVATVLDGKVCGLDQRMQRKHGGEWGSSWVFAWGGELYP